MGPCSDPAEIPLGASDEETKALICGLCTRILPGWSGVDAGELELTPISGGISNLLVKVTPTTHTHLTPVAVKVFGNKTELLVDRVKELEQLLKLNECGFGAEVVGIFANGRIETFLTAKTLEPEEMLHDAFVPRIASLLRRLHAVPTDGVPTLWPTVLQWLDMAEKLEFEDAGKRAKFAAIDFPAQRREIAELKALCDRVPSAIVFSHNDLLSGNILVVLDTSLPEGEQVERGTIQFIDYEYSDCGYRGFDFGNHFNEYAGFECDYSRYPGPAAQSTFFRHYLAAATAAAAAAPAAAAAAAPAAAAAAAPAAAAATAPDAAAAATAPAAAAATAPDAAAAAAPAAAAAATALAAAAATAPDAAAAAAADAAAAAATSEAGTSEAASSDPHDAELAALEAEANVFSLASHVYWGVWSLIQVGFTGFARTRPEDPGAWVMA
ncbi:hypothetical protein FOA52_008586 [Chlamydomonas sp. UWO 241]|nr:hypothetical protein FOA52_008586 [Chlamydomonas sp. UWO 241]